MKIGDYLKKNRKMQHMTIIELAELSGVSKSYISQIENNTSNGWESIAKLLSALGLSVDDANAAGVQWWAADSKSTNYNLQDYDFISEWLSRQDRAVLREIRTLIELLDSRED